jgi:4-hydroxy-tetrahydrodipicolinate reductase
MLKIGVCGIAGRMGTAVLREMLDRGHSLAAAFDSASSPSFGRDAGELLGRAPLGVKVGAISGDEIAKAEGLVDFSSPASSMTLLAAAREARRPLVIGTTGFTSEGRKAIEDAAREIPVLFSPNMSVAVNLLFKLTGVAAAALGGDFEVEVFEAHHRFKKDAPSGTAKKLVEVVKGAVGRLKAAPEVYDRSAATRERDGAEIGVMALRGGDIVGEHTVYFVGMGERLELTHRATSRDIFARGAVRAVEYLAGREPGLYSMNDVLGV